MIAHEVAKTCAHEAPRCKCFAANKPEKISVHLFKLRLVSRTFSCAATSVFVDLARRKEFTEYKVLYLPPKSVSLEDLAKIFTSKDRTLANLITKVVYQITTARDEDIDTEYLADYFGDMLDDHDDPLGKCVRASAAKVHELIDRNVSLFGEHCSAGAKFANDLCSTKGVRNFRAVLAGLRKLKAVRIEVEDFWDDTFDSFASSTSQHGAVGLAAYHEGVPAILEHLSKSGATNVQLDGFGSHAWAGLEPIKTIKLAKSRNFLAKITHFELGVSRRDDVFMEDWMQEPEHGPMRRGDRINILLNCLKGLRSLVITSEPFNSEKDDTQWLDDVLIGQTWPLLRSFTLKHAYVRSATLSSFFLLHKSLKAVVLDGLYNISSPQWYELLDTLRSESELSTASITIHEAMCNGDPRMIQIKSEHGKDARAPWVDLGAYVVKMAKVEELD